MKSVRSTGVKGETKQMCSKNVREEGFEPGTLHSQESDDHRRQPLPQWKMSLAEQGWLSQNVLSLLPASSQKILFWC